MPSPLRENLRAARLCFVIRGINYKGIGRMAEVKNQIEKGRSEEQPNSLLMK